MRTNDLPTIMHRAELRGWRGDVMLQVRRTAGDDERPPIHVKVSHRALMRAIRVDCEKYPGGKPYVWAYISADLFTEPTLVIIEYGVLGGTSKVLRGGTDDEWNL